MTVVSEALPTHRDGFLARSTARIRRVRLGLAAKIVLAVGATGAIITVALTVYMYLGSLDILVQRNTERLSRSLEVGAARLVSRIDLFRQDTVMLAKTPPVTGIFRVREGDIGIDPLDASTERMWNDRLATIFEGLVEARPDYFQVRYIGLEANGREIVRVDRLPDGTIRRVPETELQDQGDRPYLADSVNIEDGQVHLSPIDLNRKHGEIEVPYRPVMRAATPVRTPVGETLGVIVINVDMGRLFDILEQDSSDSVVHFVANRDGDYLAHSNPDKVFGFDKGRRNLMQDDFPSMAALFGGDAEQLSGVVDGPNGRALTFARRVHYDPLDPAQFIVITEMLPESLLSADIGELRNETLLVAAILLSLGLIAVLWQIKRSIRPLTRISQLSEAVARGERDINLVRDSARGDEIGALARNFEAMIRQVRAREDDLAARARELNRINARLLQTNRELSHFAYVASHDLQEPLRMVDSYMGLIERRYKGKLDEDADEFIGFAVDGARRMKRLINDLLEYSRVSNRPLNVTPVDTGKIAESVLAVLRQRIEESDADVELQPLPTIEADPGQMERLFLNLIGNAIKFRGDTPPRVRVTAERQGDLWEFAIADNGIGIEPEFHQKVFEVFTRLHSREKFDGTGIGLASCRRIVEIHGGNIRIEPAPGGGTIFRFTLPSKQAGEPD